MLMLTYAQAGVDDEKTARALRGIIGLAKETFQFRRGKLGEPSEIGHYAALMDFGEFYLALRWKSTLKFFVCLTPLVFGGCLAVIARNVIASLRSQ